jgi:hypothetical protein
MDHQNVGRREVRPCRLGTRHAHDYERTAMVSTNRYFPPLITASRSPELCQCYLYLLWPDGLEEHTFVFVQCFILFQQLCPHSSLN